MVCTLLLLLLLLPPLFAPLELLEGSQCCTLYCTCSFSERFVHCFNASLSSLPPGIPPATVELNLQFNQLDRLLPASFPDLPELSTLYLGNSHIRQIEPGAFQGVKNLYHLHLDGCLLKEIPEGVFGNLTNLAFLHLEHNRIAYISPGAFASLERLTVLDLSYNLLTDLSDQTFRGLQQLRQLYLSANLIANLSARALPSSLRTLYLDQNQLKTVPVAIRTSVALANLHLSGNPIEELTALSFGRKLSSLRQLFLDNMPLENTTGSAFKRLRRLELLSLRNNSLESLSSLASLKYLSTLYLTGNKWHCDCNLIWLRTWQKRVIRKDRSPVECSFPEALQGQLLVNIEVTTSLAHADKAQKHLQKLSCPPFQTDAATVGSSAEVIFRTATPPNEEPLPQAASTVFTASITSRTTSSIGPNIHNNHHILETYDPCLSDHIRSISTRTKGNTVLMVTWSFSGEHEQFEVRCKSSVDQHILRVIGELTEIELHHLQPGTDYSICIIPQNKNLFECVAPKAQQCTSGHTGTHALPQHRNSDLGIGVSVTLLALIGLAVFGFYRWQTRQIRFQRYYDEDNPSSQPQVIAQSKWTTESVYESFEDDQHVYMTTANQWSEAEIDCTTITQATFSPTPTYATP